MKKTNEYTNKKEVNEIRKSRSQWQDVIHRFKKDKLAMVGLFIILAIIVISISANFFIDYELDVTKQDVRNKLQPPSKEHIFGTDSLGRDIFSRIVWGSRYSLIIGFLSTGLALVGGGAIGAVAGYYGGKIDNILMRIMDMFIAIPTTLLAIAIVSALGPGIFNLIIAMSISNVPGYARLIRSSVLTIKDSEFVEASVAVGASDFKIIMKHIIPNTLAPIVVQATLGVGFAIVAASGLSYLGLGIMPPDPEWGNMLSEGQDHIRNTPYLVLFPGFSIMITVLALNLLGDGLRDAIDPKMKN